MSSNPDRELLEQINRAWDRRSDADHETGSPDSATEYVEMIDTLHSAGAGVQPRAAFKQKLRDQLLSDAEGRVDQPDHHHPDDIDDPNEITILPTPLDRNGDGSMETTRRRWWLSHTGELAAIILILFVAIAAAAIWQSGEGGESSPGTAGDSDDREEAVPTPSPAYEEGIWTDLTVEEAQAVTPFELVIPVSLPDGYEIDGIRVMDMSESDAGEAEEREDGEPWMVAVIPLVPESGNDQMIELLQGNFRIPYPSVEMSTDGRFETPSESPYDEDTQHEILDMDGVEVSNVVRQMGEDRQQSIYAWAQDGLGMLVSQSTSEWSDEQDDSEAGDDPPVLRTLVEAMLTQRSSNDEPPMAPGMMQESESETSVPDESDIPPSEFHEDLSVGEAQEIVPFDIIDPRSIHDDYELASVSVNEPPMGDRFHVAFEMEQIDTPGRSVQLFQQNSRLAMPNLDITPSGSPAIGPDGEVTDEVDTPDPVREEITIDGLNVTHTIQYNLGGDQSTNYHWYQDGTGVSLYALTEVHEENTSDLDPEHAVPAEDLRDIVTALVESRVSDEAPPEPEVQEPPEEHQTAPDESRVEVSLSEAREQSPFELIETDLLPGELQFAHAELLRSENGQPVDRDRPEIDSPNRAHIYFGSPPGADQPYSLEIVQTTDTIPNPEGEMMEVAGHPVEFVSGTMGTSFQAGWIWEVGEVEYGILVTAIDGESIDVTEEIAGQLPISNDRAHAIIASTLE